VTVERLNSHSRHLTYFICCGLFKTVSLDGTGLR